MREDIEEPGLHAGEGKQQNPNLKPNAREDKEAVEPASDPEDARLCNRHRPRDRLRGETQVCRVLRLVW